MKSLVYAMVAASAFSIPLASFAQSTDNGPVPRDQVKQELIQLEQAGYNPATHDDPYYPNDIQAAEARVHAQEGQALATADTSSSTNASGYGGVAPASAQSGSPSETHPINGSQSLYFGK